MEEGEVGGGQEGVEEASGGGGEGEEEEGRGSPMTIFFLKGRSNQGHGIAITKNILVVQMKSALLYYHVNIDTNRELKQLLSIAAAG